MLPLPLQPLRPHTASEEQTSASSSSDERNACLRLRTTHPNGINRAARMSPVGAWPKLGRCIAPVVVVVEMLSVEVCAVLLLAKVRLAGAKVQEADVGRVPQAKVTVPV